MLNCFIKIVFFSAKAEITFKVITYVMYYVLHICICTHFANPMGTVYSLNLLKTSCGYSIHVSQILDISTLICHIFSLEIHTSRLDYLYFLYLIFEC
jgi:hypothetical protein